MEILTVAEMQEVDRRTIADHIPGPQLMEQAGAAVYQWIESELTPGPDVRAQVLCGRGNNGGDGFVVARHLMDAGCEVTLYVFCDVEEINGDARIAFDRLDSPRIVPVSAETTVRFADRLEAGDLVIDALLGTGLKSRLRDPYLSVIRMTNEQRARKGLTVLSVDIPSGIDGDTGEVRGEAIRADATVTIGRPKMGLVFEPGRSHTGRVIVARIGFPEDVVREVSSGRDLPEPAGLGKLIPPRDPAGHKYRSGSVAVLSGSRDFTGAPLLVSDGAFRAGCGMVYLAAPEHLEWRIAGLNPETIFRGFPQTTEGTLALTGLEKILEWTGKARSFVMGPGIGRHPETLELLKGILQETRVPIVIDADALDLFGSEGRYAVREPERCVLTPHEGEMARLTGEEVPRNPSKRMEWARSWARRWCVTLVLKGAPTLVARPDGPVSVNPSGTNALATGGTGDVLAGILGSLLAQGGSPWDASRLGVYIHGRAGELAAADSNPRSVTASDLPLYLGEVYTELESGRTGPAGPPWLGS